MEKGLGFWCYASLGAAKKLLQIRSRHYRIRLCFIRPNCLIQYGAKRFRSYKRGHYCNLFLLAILRFAWVFNYPELNYNFSACEPKSE